MTKCTAEMLSAAPATLQNQLPGFQYDLAGNMVVNGSATFTYDAENQIKTAGGITYVYDGDGKRVNKSLGRLYWYGTGSDSLTETDGSGNLLREFVYFNGKRIARIDLPAGTVHYYFADHLGTLSEMASAAGTIENDSDYYPYGGERIIKQNVANEHYKFTGKERDSESGLDEFGARYYASTIGRFMTPDWSQYPQSIPYADPADPQSLNLYAYVINNPLSGRDIDGHSCEPDKWDPKTNTLTAGACHLDWWDLPGYWFVGGMNLMMANSPKQAWTGAKQMTYAYVAAYAADAAIGWAVGQVIEGVGTVIRTSGGKVVVERVMSVEELNATEKTGLLRGGREGSHYVTDSAPDSASAAQNELALTGPERTVKVTMEIDKSALSAPSSVQGPNGLPTGGSERTATGNVPVKVLSVKPLK